MSSDADFLRRFEQAAIPSDEWTHRDHVRMAFLYLRERPFDEALEAIRRGIRALNAANGVTVGYHETLTVAWARVVDAALTSYGPSDDFEAFARQNEHLLAKSLLRVFYSRPLIFSDAARADFVEPDLAPLPEARSSESARRAGS